jgi:hypothetical protein
MQLVAVAWVRHEDRLLFQKFSEVVFMDFTSNTTKEKIRYITCASKLTQVALHHFKFLPFILLYHLLSCLLPSYLSFLRLCLCLSFSPSHVIKGRVL